MKTWIWRAALVGAVAVLSGCGGGGGGGTGGSGGGDTPPPDTTGKLTLTGVVTKGRMANAEVNAYPVAANGTVSATPVLASPVISDSNGLYNLQFTPTAGVLYVVQVKAVAGSTHLDEVTGQRQALPVGFTMRAPFITDTTQSVTLTRNVTAFSEMAIKAAEGAGLTVANARQGVSTVTQLFGFDPTQVSVKTTSDAVTEDEKKQALLLTAVSKLAQDGGLGCSTGTEGERAQCVVQALARSASLDSIKLEDGDDDVSSELKDAIEAVLGDDDLKGEVDDSTLVGVIDNLSCTGDDCVAAPVTTVSAIESAKAFFNQIKSDWLALFSRGGASNASTAGAVNQEAYKFREAIQGIEAPGEQLDSIVDVAQHGTELYQRFKNGASTAVKTGWSWSFGAGVGQHARACTLYTDWANQTEATASTPYTSIVAIGCRTTVDHAYVGEEFNLDGQWQPRTQTWMYGYKLVPPVAGSNEFGYTVSSVLRTCRKARGSAWVELYGCNGEDRVVADQVLGVSGQTGTLAWSDNAVAINGKLSSMLMYDASTNANGPLYNGAGIGKINLNGTRSTAVDANLGMDLTTVAASGTLSVYSDSAATSLLSRLKLNSGSTLVLVPEGASVVGGTRARLDLSLGNAAAEVAGVLDLSNGVMDLSNTRLAPTQWQFSGALRNADTNGVMRDVVAGTASLSSSDWAQFDAQAAETNGGSTLDNHFTVSFQFVGTVTAPSRPVLELTLGTSLKSYQSGADVSSVNLQYRALQNGTPRTVVAVTGTRNANTGVFDFHLSEATTNLSMDWREGASSAWLKASDTTIGQFNSDSLLLTFTDHSFMSLDLGL